MKSFELLFSSMFYFRRFSFCFICVFLLSVGSSAVADPKVAPQGIKPLSGDFAVPPGLQSYVDFWIGVFAKYGKNQSVFHHRDHPGIVYSVLDFSEFAEQFSGRQFEQKKNAALRAETADIERALKSLAQNRPPSGPIETRIKRLFQSFSLDSRKEYLKAADLQKIRSQTGIQERFREGVVRSGRYLYAIEHIFESEGLPVELGRLPLVESSFDYNAYSSVGAAGIWQFMRATGRRYLRIDASIDERRDPILASRAAARYLKHSYSRLPHWSLAVTSYNHGLNGVMRAANATGSTDLVKIIHNYESKIWGFASQNFYAEFLAALQVEQNQKYYFPGIQREAEVHFDEIELTGAAGFHDLVRASGMNAEDFKTLNPAFMSPVREGRVRVPAGALFKVPSGRGKQAISRLGNGRVYSLDGANQMFDARATAIHKGHSHVQASGGGTGGYQVQSGDTVGAIARKFGVRERALMAENGISDPRRLRVGSRIRIPGRNAGHSGTMASSTTSGSDYTVQSGDTLSAISRKTGVSMSNIRRLNPGLSDKIKPGQRIVTR